MSIDANNPLVTNFITRAEYEARHAETTVQLSRFDTKLDSLSNKLDTYNAAINARIDKTISDFDAELTNEREHRMLVQIKAWKFVGLQFISIIVGGVTYAVGEFLILHHF